MKKIIIIAIFLLAAFFLFKNIERNSEEIRVRVIPNSNIESDILIKGEVLEKTIVFLNENFDSNRESLIKNIKSNLNVFNNELEEYNTFATLENHNFYNKEYNGNVLKNGTYLTLLVKIGDARGDNWWGSIFPNFLEVESSDTVEYKSLIKKILER